MLENSLFTSNVTGADGFYWWIGQIVDNKTWQDNVVSTKFEEADQIKGFGSRYKVRIFGHHTDDKKDIDDMQLPWAQVMLPVTAGGGQNGVSQTPGLKQGNIVFGYFLDGMEAQQPIIMGILGNNDQTSLEKKIPEKGFIPTSGFANGERVPTYGIPVSSSSGTPKGTTSNGGVESGKGSATNSGKPLEGDGANVNRTNNQDSEQEKDGNVKSHLSKSSKCGGNDMDGISTEIEKLVKFIERLQNLVDDWGTAASQKITDIADKINLLIERGAKVISRFIKTIIDFIRKFVTEKFNSAAKNTYFLLMPNERPKLKDTQHKALDLLWCLFNKIIAGLIELVTASLKNTLDKVVNVASCVAESIVGNILNKVTGFLSGAIDAILGPINAILSGVGGALSLAGDILGLLQSILGFLSCDENPDCPEVDTWSTWGGISSGLGSSLTGAFEKAKAIGQDVGGAFADSAQTINDLIGSVGSGAQDILATTGCDVGPLLCGPPTVSFFGSGGSGAEGNAIVGPTGEVIGIDIISTGSGYGNSATVKITDPCGNGSGAIGKVVLGPSQPKGKGGNAPKNRGKPGTGVIEVVMINPGSGYKKNYNGSQGGMGRTWAQPYQTTIKRANGTYERPLNPDKIVDICPGDIVTIPYSCTAELYDIDTGEILQTFVSGRNLVRSKKCGRLTTPRISDADALLLEQQGLSENDINNTGLNAAVTSNGSYPVITQICDILIKNPGINYSPTDTITISPANGAILEPVYGEYGRLIKVNILDGGIGFTEVPEIYIESETGYNAVIIPLMCVNRKGNDLAGDLTPDERANVISVVNCVGKF